MKIPQFIKHLSKNIFMSVETNEFWILMLFLRIRLNICFVSRRIQAIELEKELKEWNSFLIRCSFGSDIIVIHCDFLY